MILYTENLSKKFKNIIALKDINVEIENGVSLILGPNGGGKSTLLKLALGLFKPTEGEIRIFGENPWTNSQIRKRIGVSFDPASFPKFVSGKEYISFLSDIKSSNRDIDYISKLFGITDFMERRIDTYSSGMRKRLSVAQAFVGEPELIILDEPLANIDREGALKIIEAIMEYKNEKNTNFLISSHIFEPLQDIIDNILVLVNGEQIVTGNIDTLNYKTKIFSFKIPEKNLIEFISELKDEDIIKNINREGKDIIIRFSSSRSYKDILGDLFY